MEPSIQTGSLVVIKPETDYKVGDVITFGEDTRVAIPTTHRIFSISEKNGDTYYTTKGDANNEPDPNEVNRRDVIGRVLVSVPYAGFILDFAKKPIGFVLLIGLPAGIIIIDESCRIIQEIIAMRRRRKKVYNDSEDEE
jgi:signal peptidase